MPVGVEPGERLYADVKPLDCMERGDAREPDTRGDVRWKPETGVVEGTTPAFFQGRKPLPTVASARGGGDLLVILLHWAASMARGVPPNP